MSLTDNLWRFNLSLRLSFFALVASVASFTLYTLAQDSLRAANEQRYSSMMLAHELRQSSDDLTRMVRTYVVTGDRRYRAYYEEIAAIRDGLSPRPQEYDNVYWDLVLDERRPTPMGPAEALLQRMTDLGFTQEELHRLTVAKTNSDRLISTEHQAMALVEADSNVPDESLQQNRLEALRLLHDAAYHLNKADIMRPIAEVIRMVDDRTVERVRTIEWRIRFLLGVFVISSIVLISMLLMIRRNLRLVLGGSVSKLSEIAVNASNGGMPTGASTGDGDPDSIIGKLIEVHQVSVRANGQWRDCERALSESERRFRSIADKLKEGVCVVQDALIRFVNPKVSEILNQSETDLMDRPFFQFVHPDDREVLMERYRNRSEGGEVESSSEFQVSTGSGEVRKIKTRVSNFDWAGRPATLYFINIIGESHTS